MEGDFKPGDIVIIEHVNHWGKRYMVIKDEFDSTIMESWVTIREIGSNWEKTAEWTKMRYILKKIGTTKLGGLLYGWNPEVRPANERIRG